MDLFQIGMLVQSLAVVLIGLGCWWTNKKLKEAERKIALLFREGNRVTALEMKVSDLEKVNGKRDNHS